MQQDAADAARTNATQSLALERSLQPDVADTRANLSKMVNDQLKLGGTLPPDVANLVAREARVQGGMSGGFGGTPGVTAATLGTTALGLMQQRQANARDLLAANPTPVAGLDPGQIASLEIANNNAENQFGLEKAGVQSNLINSNAAVNNSAIGAGSGALSSLLNAYNKTSTPAPSTTYVLPQASTIPAFNSTIPQYNASLIPGRG